jgi:hypothetical protein
MELILMFTQLLLAGFQLDNGCPISVGENRVGSPLEAQHAG